MRSTTQQLAPVAFDINAKSIASSTNGNNYPCFKEFNELTNCIWNKNMHHCRSHYFKFVNCMYDHAFNK